MYLTSHVIEIIITLSVLTACVLLAAVTWNSFPTCSTICLINCWCNYLWGGESTFLGGNLLACSTVTNGKTYLACTAACWSISWSIGVLWLWLNIYLQICTLNVGKNELSIYMVTEAIKTKQNELNHSNVAMLVYCPPFNAAVSEKRSQVITARVHCFFSLSQCCW